MMRRFTGAVRHSVCGSCATARRFARPPLHRNDDFANGAAANYIDDLFIQWQANPASVSESWQTAFAAANANELGAPILSQPVRVASVATASGSSLSASPSRVGGLSSDSRVLLMIERFRSQGHLCAKLDPLDFENDPNGRVPYRSAKTYVSLAPSAFGFSDAELDAPVVLGVHGTAGGLLNIESTPMTVRQLHNKLTSIYCSQIGWEFNHIADEKVTKWLADRVETPDRVASNPLGTPLTATERGWILEDLAAATQFEAYFKVKYGTKKRFGLEGGESFLVGLNALAGRATLLGCQEIVLGMAHRGRLSILCNFARKPFPAIIKEFEGLKDLSQLREKEQGDVKYHLGMVADAKLREGRVARIQLLTNPSHLETVNPLVEGKVRAAQFQIGDTTGTKVVPVAVHGDAAFSAQGVVYETMGLSKLQGYGTGGTIHIVTNNQVGFTTDPKSSRSSLHCTAIGQVFGFPVVHVNGDHPEEVYRVFQLAADFRHTFKSSIIIDLVCYRKNGHNESDNPEQTQPLLYKLINKQKDVCQLYGETLVKNGQTTSEEFKAVVAKKRTFYREQAELAGGFDYAAFVRSIVEPAWTALRGPNDRYVQQPTAVSIENLNSVVNTLCTVPASFKPHKLLEGVLERRTESLKTGKSIAWATAEALAWGTLLAEGTHVRVSGEDVQRGTFSQRHAVFHDQVTGERYCQLEHISKGQARFEICNSLLSEYAVLGYEAGYSMQTPNSLVVWEAQFGDFANGAQIIFDQYFFAGESKWQQEYATVVSLPHGYSGDGAEHSSGRLERFLQAVNEDPDSPVRDPIEARKTVNIEVVYPTTAAQYFHFLRRQVRRNFRKPAMLFFSKAFLRSEQQYSTLEELARGAFMPVIDDVLVGTAEGASAKADIDTVLFCTGQVYYHLEKARAAGGKKNTAIVRIEELAPFPLAEVERVLASYPSTARVRWVQEEPRNMGAFNFVEQRLANLLGDERLLECVGRATHASPATGSKKIHEKEHQKILSEAFA